MRVARAFACGASLFLLSSCIYSTATARIGALTHVERDRLEIFAPHGGRTSDNHHVTSHGVVVGMHVQYCRREGSIDTLEGEDEVPGQPLVLIRTKDVHGRPASRAMDANTGQWLEDAWVNAEYTGAWEPRAFCCGSTTIVRHEDDTRVIQRTLRQGDVVTRRAFSFGPHLPSREQVDSHIERDVSCLGDGALALLQLSYHEPKQKKGPRVAVWFWPRTSDAPLARGSYDVPKSCPSVDAERMHVTLAQGDPPSRLRVDFYDPRQSQTICGTLDIASPGTP